MLHAQVGKGSGKQPPAHPFFYGARSRPCVAFIHAGARLSADMGCGIYVTAILSIKAIKIMVFIIPFASLKAQTSHEKASCATVLIGL